MEISIDTELLSTNDFNLTFGGNIGFNKTKITNLAAQPLDEFYIDGIAEERRFYFGAQVTRGNIFRYPANVFVEGEETSLFYGLETDGIYQTGDVLPDVFGSTAVPGDVKIVDQNGDGIIDLNDRTFIGNPNLILFTVLTLISITKDLMQVFYLTVCLETILQMEIFYN